MCFYRSETGGKHKTLEFQYDMHQVPMVSRATGNFELERLNLNSTTTFAYFSE